MRARNVAVVAGIAAAAVAVCGPVQAKDRPDSNPLVGKAVVSINTPTANKSVVGKGYYADLYGYYGNYYSSLANSYGTYGYYYKYYPYYQSAYGYAYDSYIYYYYAYVNQRNGT